MFRALGEPRSQAIVLQNLGSIYLEARDLRARPALLRAGQRGLFRRSRADPFRAQQSRQRAQGARPLQRRRGEFGRALEAARAIDSDLLQARILSNLASALAAQGSSTGPTRPPAWACRSRTVRGRAGSRSCGASAPRSPSPAATSRPPAAISNAPSPASTSTVDDALSANSTTPPARSISARRRGRPSGISPPSSASTTKPGTSPPRPTPP